MCSLVLIDFNCTTTFLRMSLFTKKTTPSEQMRQQDRDLRRIQRGIEKDRRDLERQEKQLEMEIKKAAKQGNKQVCTVLAKQLVQLRKQKTRTYTAGSKVQSIGAQSKGMHSNLKLASAMGQTTKAMGVVNKQMKPEAMMKTIQDFEKQNMKMEMTEEMMEDTLNAVFDESGDEEEQDAIVTQVLDEIGIEITGKVSDAPAAYEGKLGETSKACLPTDEEIEKQLAQLKA
ncbi:charged multivesicular body protein 2b isoform X2 [Tachypleus tridentatus]|uniref:charged multivesicular body protein 2b isoform X2 n=1 Tax=Tachypleus tridentatus TaxID=6853 RepID=UPI003FD2D6CA